MANSMDIADYVVKKSNDINKPVSNLQLQKVLYFLNAIHLVNFGNALITNENFERWNYGPVLRSVYFEYSSNGSNPIKRIKPRIDIKYNNGIMQINEDKFDLSKIEEKLKSFIDSNLNRFVNEAPFYLVKKSHEETQWKELGTNDKYSDEKTKEYYSNEKNQFWRAK